MGKSTISMAIFHCYVSSPVCIRFKWNHRPTASWREYSDIGHGMMNLSEWSDSHFGDSPCYTMGGTSHANTIGQSSGWFPGFVLGEWHVFLNLLVPPLTATTVGMVFGHKSQHSSNRLCKVMLDNGFYRTTRIPCQRLWSVSIHTFEVQYSPVDLRDW